MKNNYLLYLCLIIYGCEVLHCKEQNIYKNKQDSLITKITYFYLAEQAMQKQNTLLQIQYLDSALRFSPDEIFLYDKKVSALLLMEDYNSVSFQWKYLRDSLSIFNYKALISTYKKYGQRNEYLEIIHNLELQDTSQIVSYMFDDCPDSIHQILLNNQYLDQYYRTLDNPDSLLWAKQDSSNLYYIIKLLNYRSHGLFCSSLYAIFVIHCNEFYEKEWIYITNRLYFETLLGNFDPATYALIIDNRYVRLYNKPQIYGTMANFYQTSEFEVLEPSQLDKRRAEIGLPPYNIWAKTYNMPLPLNYIP